MALKKILFLKPADFVGFYIRPQVTTLYDILHKLPDVTTKHEGGKVLTVQHKYKQKQPQPHCASN